MLQTWHDIFEEKRSQQSNAKPDLTKFLSATFWDTDINLIDWQKQSKAVIQRVFERGNETEKKEIIRFYGTTQVEKTLASLNEKSDTPPPPVQNRNVIL